MKQSVQIYQKKIFASGTLIAARYIIGKDNGIYKVGNLIE